MDNKLKCIVDEKYNEKKLISYLKGELNMSSRFTRKIARENLVTINDVTGRNDSILRTGDIIVVSLDAGDTQDISPEEMNLDICFEDSDILVVNKPPFMVVHPTKSYQEGTLSNGVIYYFRQKGNRSIVRLVNRLDRDTSGLVIIAKSQFAHQQMAEKLMKDQIEKSYYAIVEGKLEGSGTIDLPIDRPTEDSIKRAVLENGQRAVTHYESVKAGSNMSLVRLRLETGRTHQIRVHLSHMGHPIVGDSLYGTESTYINRQALHSYKLTFTTVRENTYTEVECDIPQDMQEVIRRIECE